jgi:hypothetical protein
MLVAGGPDGGGTGDGPCDLGPDADAGGRAAEPQPALNAQTTAHAHSAANRRTGNAGGACRFHAHHARGPAVMVGE